MFRYNYMNKEIIRSKLLMVGKKVLAHTTVAIRPARTGNNPPIIVSIPRKIADVMKLKIGEDLRMYTDGERIYLDKFEEPTI
jgi:hypothetical protein